MNKTFFAACALLGRLIAGVVRRVTGSRADMVREDVEQKVLVALGRRNESEHTIDYPSSYIYRMAVREAVRMMRKESSRVSVITVLELPKRMTPAAGDMRGWLIPGIACAVLYLALSFPLSELARRLERKLARDQRPHTL